MQRQMEYPVNVDDRDWRALTRGERIRMIEEEGYLIIPDWITSGLPGRS